jgi:adenylate cyclase
MSNLAEAVRHWRRVRDLLGAAPESDEAAALAIEARAQVLSRGFRLGYPEGELEALFAEGMALAERRGDLPAQVRLVVGASADIVVTGNVPRYLERTLEATRLAERTGDGGLRAATCSMLVYAHLLAGRFEECRRYVEEGLRHVGEDASLGRDVLGYSPYLLLLNFRAALLGYSGRVDEATRELERAGRLARQHGDLENLGWSHDWSVSLQEFAGDAEAALRHAQEAMECAERSGSSFSLVGAYQSLAKAHRLAGRPERAVPLLEQAHALACERRVGQDDQVERLRHLAEACLACGDGRRARSFAEEAVAVARRQGMAMYEPQALLALARARLAGEDLPAAESALAEAEAVAGAVGLASLRPLLLLERAELARVAGDAPARRLALEEARRLFAAIGARARADALAPQVA